MEEMMEISMMLLKPIFGVVESCFLLWFLVVGHLSNSIITKVFFFECQLLHSKPFLSLFFGGSVPLCEVPATHDPRFEIVANGRLRRLISDWKLDAILSPDVIGALREKYHRI